LATYRKEESAVEVRSAMLYRRRLGTAWSGPAAWTAIGVLTAESPLGILTVGAFILPAAVLLTLSMRLVPSGEPAAAGLAAES
jgi:hypothetical protein